MHFVMASAPPLAVSPEEFKLFHAMDRKLYALLINDLWRDPLESMRIMALWLWLERSGFNNVIKKVLSLPQVLINELADEAVTCLTYLENDNNDNKKSFLSLSEPIDNIPLTQNLVDKEISAQYFHENRLSTIQGVAKILTEVCLRALTDIMEQAMERNAVQYMTESEMLMSSLVQPRLKPVGLTPGFDLIKPRGGVPVHDGLHPDDRTMFVTFSKGYPVVEREIREFFTKIYGDCIESLYMQEVMPGEQSLFARIVFYSPAAIEMILNGEDKAKFTINGKHMWMRKFVSKRQKSSSSPPSPLVSCPEFLGAIFSRYS